MAITTKVKKTIGISTFKPVILTIEITIYSKDSLKNLQNEFEEANLDTYSLGGGCDNIALPTITEIIKEIEEVL